MYNIVGMHYFILSTPFNFLVAVQSLSGHTSAVESVGFDSTEVFVAAGAASGTIKLWDLEEAKSTSLWIFNLLVYAFMDVSVISSVS
jgi:WD40 repeat protein